MAIYLITHGKRVNGHDPAHTPEGLAQIARLPVPRGISLLVAGNARRFLEVLGVVKTQLPADVRVMYSPFCGGPEGFEGDDGVVLADGRTISYHRDYIGLSNGPLDMWQFVKSLPDGTLLCAGGGLLIGLGFEAIYESGHLYELNVEARTAEKIA